MQNKSLLERAGYALGAPAAPAPAVAPARTQTAPTRVAPAEPTLLQRLAARLPQGKHGVALLVALMLLAVVGPTATLFARGESDDRADASNAYSDPDMGDAERPGSNFPGSAFYFLAEEQAAKAQYAAMDADALASETGLLVGAADAQSGPAAAPFRIAQSGSDYGRALRCLTDAIYYEAALEPDVGQRAVAQVILNRVRHPSYPDTVCGVIYQGSERVTGCQFSYSCDGSMARTPSRSYWDRAQRVARAALAGAVYAPVGHATHYHTTEIHPYWAPSLNYLRVVGAHRFYSFKGSAGRPSAFFRKYAGGEPLPQPHARRAVAGTDGLDPTALQADFDRKYAKAQAEAERIAREEALRRAQAEDRARLNDIALAPGTSAAPYQHAAPQYSAQAASKGGDTAYKASRLPDSQVRTEYAQSGSWKF